MHTDLSPHLHTDECNKIIQALSDCHDENRFARFLGVCNSFDNQMVKCLKRERQARRDKNYEESRIKRAAIRERLANLPKSNI